MFELVLLLNLSLKVMHHRKTKSFPINSIGYKFDPPPPIFLNLISAIFFMVASTENIFYMSLSLLQLTVLRKLFLILSFVLITFAFSASFGFHFSTPLTILPLNIPVLQIIQIFFFSVHLPVVYTDSVQNEQRQQIENRKSN